MEKQRLTYLLTQYLAQEATSVEQEALSSFLKANTNQELFADVMASMIPQEAPAYPTNADVWQKMVKDIVSIDRSAVKPVKATIGKIFRLPHWAAAAAILLLVSTSIYFFINRGHKQGGTEQTLPALAMAPVSSNVLSFSDGSQVLLDEVKNGPISSRGNITITKQDHQLIYSATDPNPPVEYQVISTARSSEYEIILTDGSHVWLNAASSFRFPTSFSGKERIVELSGEAWFDVQHADKIPFRIHSGQYTTSVLGTAFDIKAYSDQNNMTVSVQRGRVKVQAGSNILATLEKGQQLRIIADTIIRKQPIDTAAISSWKRGELRYDDETLESIVADLQRVYKDSILITNNALKNVQARVVFKKSDGLEKILQVIGMVFDCQITKKNDIISIE